MDVYFIQVGIDGPIKIGITKNIENRMRSLQTSSPYELRLLWSFQTSGSIEAEERRLHEWFKFQHIKGEWFRPDSYLTSCIDRMKNGEDFSDDWIEVWNDISEIQHDLIEVVRKYRDAGNFYAVKYIAKEMYELHRDLMENKI